MKNPAQCTVLVVDDEEYLREAIAFDLKRKGFQVVAAANGNEAFEVIQTREIDAVVSDIRMPVCNGIELVQKIRDRNLDLPPIVLITGFADFSIEDAYDFGACGFFPKPYDRKILMDTLLRMIQTRAERWAGEPPSEPAVRLKLNLPGLGHALDSQLISIGRGGIFVSNASEFPWPNQEVSFQIEFDSGESPIIGIGAIRWVRPAEKEGLHEGCGIEILKLSSGSRENLIQRIEVLQNRAFIPKT